MNAIDDSTLYAALDAAKDKRQEIRAKLEASTQTLMRARRVATTATDKLKQHEAADIADQNAQAQRLEDLLAAGGPSADLPPVLDDSGARSLASVRLNASITAKALASIEASHAQLAADLKSAESEVTAAAKRALIHEGEKLAVNIGELESKALHLKQELLGLRGDDRYRPMAERMTSPLIDRALRLSMDTQGYPPSQLSDLLEGIDVARNVRLPLAEAAEKRWFQRLAELIDGEPSQTGDRAA